MPRGSKLDNGLDLAEHLGISRPTMRAAIKQLVDKGPLVRRRRIGTTGMPKLVRRAVALTRKDGAEGADLLEVEPGDSVLTMSRVAYDASGRPIEYGSHVYLAESCWLEIMLVEL